MGSSTLVGTNRNGTSTGRHEAIGRFLRMQQPVAPQAARLSDPLEQLFFNKVRVAGVTISVAQSVCHDPVATEREDKILETLDFVSTIFPDPDIKQFTVRQVLPQAGLAVSS